MCNHLSFEKKALVLSLLVEGNSIRCTERICDVHRDTIMRLMIKASRKARKVHDIYMRDLHLKTIQADEIWCYVRKKQKNLTQYERNNEQLGNQFIFVALDADSKLVPVYTVGKRDTFTTYKFIYKLSKRVNSHFQLSTDSFSAYRDVIGGLLGSRVDYAQIHKNYCEDRSGEKRYSPAQIINISIIPLHGTPTINNISTSYIERQNLTMRMQMRRFTRLTNAFSKKFENLVASTHLHFFHYNFMRIHKTLRCTPAMEACISKTIWNWNELLSYN